MTSRFKPKGKERRNLEDLIFGSSDLKPRVAKRDATSARRVRFPKALHPSKVKGMGVFPFRTFDPKTGDQGIISPTKVQFKSTFEQPSRNRKPQT